MKKELTNKALTDAARAVRAAIKLHDAITQEIGVKMKVPKIKWSDDPDQRAKQQSELMKDYMGRLLSLPNL
jgi:hypothetical protein